MVKSMTGFAALDGGQGDWATNWELRSVNARGLDVRVRAPDWIPGLDQDLKKAVSAPLGRGNVTLNLRLSRAEASTRAVNEEVLDQTLATIRQITARAEAIGLELSSPTAPEIMGLEGVLQAQRLDEDALEALRAMALKELPGLISKFQEMRAAEGASLATVLTGQIDQIADLTARALEAATARDAGTTATLKTKLDRVLSEGIDADPDRIAQEIALIAIKADVTEEIDRLTAHVDAARTMLISDAPVGRKLDFLMQEFNREANTLCSKAGDTALTRIGLDLKAVIDQMREQVQNIE